MSVFEFSDFSGGYFTDVPPDKMKDNELLTAENCYWRNGLKQRGGKASLVSLTGSNIRGGIRAKVAGNWYTFIGMDTTAAGAVEFKYGTSTVFTTLAMPSGTAYSFTTGKDVQFAVLDERVVAVNGTDKPVVIWNSYTATMNFQVNTVEEYDKRLMDNDDWHAGQYMPSLTATAYITDTTDAQSAASTDFSLASTTYTSGFWVGCFHTFNKITLYDVAANATVSVNFEYYGRASSAAATGWVSFAPINVPTWTAAGNKEIEMTFPIDPGTNEILMESVASLNSSIGGVFAIRGTAVATQAAAWAAAYVKVEHSQYLSQLLLNDKPDTVATHKSHLLFGMGNWMRISPYSTIKGWREADKEYFSEGGLIQSMVPHLDYLAILLDNAIYGLYGDSWQNWSTKLLVSNKGTIAKRSAVVVNEEVYFVARDGIYGWNGSRLLKLSKHIQSDFVDYNAVAAAAAQIKSEYWVSFPDNNHTLIFDPDSLRLDDAGDGRMSFYKFTGYRVNQFLPYTGALDSGSFIAIVNATNCRFDQLETACFDNITASATIPYAFTTRGSGFGEDNQAKVFRRLKLQFAEASATAGASYTVGQYSYGPAGTATYSSIISVNVGSSIYNTYMGVPPGIDGYNYGISVSHNSQYDATFYGFAVEAEKRSY